MEITVNLASQVQVLAGVVIEAIDLGEEDIIKNKYKAVRLKKVDSETFEEVSNKVIWKKNLTTSSYKPKLFKLWVDPKFGFKFIQGNNGSKVNCHAVFGVGDNHQAIVECMQGTDKDLEVIKGCGSRVDINAVGFSDRAGCHLTFSSTKEDGEKPSITFTHNYLGENILSNLYAEAKFSQSLIDKLIMAINTSPDPDDVDVTIKMPLNHFINDADEILFDFIKDSTVYQNPYLSFESQSLYCDEKSYDRMRYQRHWKDKVLIGSRKMFDTLILNRYLLFWIAFLVYFVVKYS